jgi:2,4-diketo-3-deoxy-L-fuconate hydrolase
MARSFKLGTFSSQSSQSFVGIVLDDAVIGLNAAHDLWRRAGGKAELPHAGDLSALIGEWDRNFETIRAIVEFLEREPAGAKGSPLASLKVLPPVRHPGKMLYAAANFADHIAEMLKAGTARTEEERAITLDRAKDKVRPYMFLKAPSALAGAYDDIRLGSPDWNLDWEVELALVIARPAKRVKAERAMDFVAGFMTSNDVTARGRLWRPDWPTLRTDWLMGKSHDTFAPMGPFFVPREFVSDHHSLGMSLKVNGEVKQQGRTGDMVFSPEEQIEQCSSVMTLAPGDIISTGTIGGVGHASKTYLKAGDVVEAEIQGLGAQRNRVVTDPV